MWGHLASKVPTNDPALCRSIQKKALEILAGEAIPEKWQEHRESCLTCIKVLRDVQRDVKKDLIKAKGVVFEFSDLSYAAGSTASWRSIQEHQLSKAGLSAGWHLDISESDSLTYRLAVVCDVKKTIRIKFLDVHQDAILELNVSQMPEYLDRVLADRCQSMVIEEI